MEMNIDNKKKIKGFYNRLWSNTDKIHRNNDNLALGWHLGFYEKGIKNQKEAMINMNNFVGKLLGLDSKNLMKILDAGCGMGGTSIHLAKKYPKITFIGITLAPNEIELAKKLQKEKKVENTEFFQRSYTDTGFPKEYFDCIFALESVSCTKSKKLFLNEMYKILKPGGKIVIIDFFRKHDSFISFVKNMRYNFLKKLEFPLEDISINTFIKYKKIKGFKNIIISNLLKTGNVKYLHHYSFIISSIFQNSYTNIQTQFKYSKDNKKTFNLLHVKCAFFIKFIFECLLLILAKPGYYSITAVKK